MGIEQTLENEIREASRWLDTAAGVYKIDLVKKIDW